MSESEKTTEETIPVTATKNKKNKKKVGASPASAPTMATMQEVLAEMDKLRQRAIILETLESACVEFFARTEYQEPKYLIQQPNGSTAVADFELVMDLRHELVMAAYTARERLRSLMGIAVPLMPFAPLPPLTEKIEPPPPGESSPQNPTETVVLNPHCSQRH